MKYMCALCGQNAEFLNAEATGTYNTNTGAYHYAIPVCSIDSVLGDGKSLSTLLLKGSSLTYNFIILMIFLNRKFHTNTVCEINHILHALHNC
jgi:hypothetical protein